MRKCIRFRTPVWGSCTYNTLVRESADKIQILKCKRNVLLVDVVRCIRLKNKEEEKVNPSCPF